MRPIVFDPIGKAPALGRLLGVAGRYRFRHPNEHGEPLPKGEFEVRDAASLDRAGFVSNEEGMCVVTDRGRSALAALLAEGAFTNAGEGLWIVSPTEEAIPDFEGDSFSSTGYTIMSAKKLSLKATDAPIANVRYTSLWAVQPPVAKALSDAGLTPPVAIDVSQGWAEPTLEAPYWLCRASRILRGASFEGLEFKGKPRLPPENPLAS